MSESRFHVTRHAVPGQHIRHYYRSTASSQEAVVQLAVNQYSPKGYDSEPQLGDVTILAAHACGYPKELYEPVWDALLDFTRRTKAFRIRNIWIADVSNQNASGVLNEGLIGNEPSWFDHSRDYLAIVNHFRKEMLMPIVGFGHSMGGNVIINLALLHPRLLTSVFLVEPIVNKDPKQMSLGRVYGITFRKDQWPSLEAAEVFFRSNPMYKNWDPETLNLWIQHGLRPSTEKQDGPVTLTTSRDQEVLSVVKKSYPPFGSSLSSFKPSREAHVDLGPDEQLQNNKGFYKPEAIMTYPNLVRLRPSCFYLYGSGSNLSSASEQGRADKLAMTGTGKDGSGGSSLGRVADGLIEGSHFLPFEKPKAVAEEAARWFAAEMRRWKDEEQKEREQWMRIPLDQRAKIDDEWRQWVKQLFGRKTAKL